MKHFILLCDYGLDDAAATAELFLRKEKEDRVDVLPVGGNMPLEQTRRNARVLLSHLSFEEGTVRLVDTSVLSQPKERLPLIHGADGMGDVLALREGFALEEIGLNAWEKTLTGEEILISLGPCTVTRYLLQRRRFSQLWLMGGTVEQTPNFRGREFNHALDVEAFAYCTRFAHKAATMDTCFHDRFNLMEHPPRSEDPLVESLLSRYLHYAVARGADRCCVFDWVLIRALFFPERFCCEKRRDPDGNLLNVLRYLG